MRLNFEQASEAFSKNLKVFEFANYLDYIELLAPKFCNVLMTHAIDETNIFDERKHNDVKKYLYDPYLSYQNNFGKLHRPLTCILAYLSASNAAFEDIHNVYAISCAIENFQSAALIHDDIADSATLRRGKPALHKQVGTELAINIGDYGLSATIGSVLHTLKQSKYSPSKILEILEQLIFMEYMTIEGQAMDLGWAKEDRFDISAQDYFVMATKKSAYYSASVPCVLGAICADAEDNLKQALETFGQKIGLAFQIRDDLLNLINDSDKLQKDCYSDITEGKLTLCAVAALDMSDKSDKEKLKSILLSHTTNKTELQSAVDIMNKSGAIEYANCQAKLLCDQALDVVRDVLPDNDWTKILIDMAYWVKNRQM